MHVSMYLAYQPIQVELSFFGKSINLAMEDKQHNERLNITMSRSQIEAITDGLKAALQASSEEKQYPDIKVRRLWEPNNEKETAVVGSSTPTPSAELPVAVKEMPIDRAA